MVNKLIHMTETEHLPAGYRFTKEFTQNVKLRNHFLS